MSEKTSECIELMLLNWVDHNGHFRKLELNSIACWRSITTLPIALQPNFTNKLAMSVAIVYGFVQHNLNYSTIIIPKQSAGKRNEQTG